MMDNTERSRLDLLVDLLAEEVARRLAAQQKPPEPRPAPPKPAVVPAAEAIPAPPPKPEVKPVRAPVVAPVPRAVAPPAAPLMARLALGICAIVVLINIPLNAQGTAIARSIPNSASLAIIDGLVVKEENSPDIYVYRDDAFRWITSLDAFYHFGFRWDQVHIVEPGFLNSFPKGKPIYSLLKCDSNPHIYRLENGQKRWIVDIPTFEAEGHVWNDIRFVSCSYLRYLPDGDSIPPGRGTPPPPLP